eukprot:3984910-Prymnesium_polylepis.1
MPPSAGTGRSGGPGTEPPEVMGRFQRGGGMCVPRSKPTSALHCDQQVRRRRGGAAALHPQGAAAQHAVAQWRSGAARRGLNRTDARSLPRWSRAA